MPKTIAEMRRRFGRDVGELGKPKVWASKFGPIRYKVLCQQCRWESRSDNHVKGQGSSWAFALHQWGEHLQAKHHVDLEGWDREYTAEMVERSEDKFREELHAELLAQGLSPEWTANLIKRLGSKP